MKKRILSAFLAFCVLLALCPAPTRAATIVASGPCGAENPEDLIWTLDENGLLTFIGSGAMKDYSFDSSKSAIRISHYGDGRGFYPGTVPWFSHRNDIKNVAIPAGITNIGNYAFRICENLFSVSISDSVTQIGTGAFESCYSLTEVDIPESVTSIGGWAFNQDDGLTSFTIPNGVTEIGIRAFSKCFKLESLTIPNSVTEIGSDAFSDCSNLTVTVYNGSYGQRYCLLNSVPHNAIDPPAYTITFHPNGGEGEPTTKTLTELDTVYGELPTPTRDGYAFMGWHTATEGGEQITSETKFDPRRNQMLYAVWAEIKETYEVTLEANGGTVEPSSVTVEAGGVYGALPEPSRNGCAFLGWFTEPSGGTQVTAETEVRLTDNQSLYAHWVATNAPEFSSNGAAVTDVREMSSETDLEGKFTVPDAADPDAFRTATAFCVLYDSAGLMVHLQSWEVDVSDTRNIRFTGSVRIPEGAQVSEIKVIVLSDELVPLQAAGTL